MAFLFVWVVGVWNKRSAQEHLSPRFDGCRQVVVKLWRTGALLFQRLQEEGHPTV